MTEMAQTALPHRAARVELVEAPGCPAEIDLLSRRAAPEHRFLTAAWYRAAGADATLIARNEGAAIAAFPTLAAGPPALGARAVAGLYWPFRNVLLAAQASNEQVTQALAAIRSDNLLGPLWRLGPVYADDPSAARLLLLAPAAGWTVLSRSLGHTYVLDVAKARSGGGAWPRPSTLKRLAGYERQLRALGTVAIDKVTGAGWSSDILDAMAAVEARSWIAEATDGTGAKFLVPAHRAFWERCIADPELAEMLSAVIVRIDGRPIAFSLDLTVGTLQYGIAGTYDAEFGPHRVGKLATERNLAWAVERGVTRIDWGAGDSGYKRQTGFEAGSEIVDCLLVRTAIVAALLRPKWTRAGGSVDARGLPLTRRESALLGTLITAATVTAMAE